MRVAVEAISKASDCSLKCCESKWCVFKGRQGVKEMLQSEADCDSQYLCVRDVQCVLEYFKNACIEEDSESS